ncbi:hypothetical protein Agub_g7004 [Astrephomene gubernaculifera]|uniref:Uncharacterized protein n=1 Tax=Astrephomene gubernaculifera TaxID=47775 RepID=A0AAD3HLY6_9CHLO|nr:hypothetical protein Agub_g7004 [Astrephomene gubernaculifera]
MLALRWRAPHAASGGRFGAPGVVSGTELPRVWRALTACCTLASTRSASSPRSSSSSSSSSSYSSSSPALLASCLSLPPAPAAPAAPPPHSLCDRKLHTRCTSSAVMTRLGSGGTRRRIAARGPLPPRKRPAAAEPRDLAAADAVAAEEGAKGLLLGLEVRRLALRRAGLDFWKVGAKGF